jgi:hypothetical protein
MDLLDAAHDERSVRASSAEQRDVLTGRSRDITPADELTDTAIADPGLERSWEERDHVALRRVEPTSGRVDAQDPAPDARHARITLGPAFLAAAEEVAAGEPTRAEDDRGKTERERTGGSSDVHQP